MCFGLLAAALFSGTAHATEPAATAHERVSLYQQEVRTALTRHAWRITQDEAGQITAEKLWLKPGAIAAPSLANYARLEIDLRADSRTHTASSARASLCLYNPFRTDHVSTMLYPPLPLRDPKLTQEYHDILAEAELQLSVDHHAYAATGTNHQPEPVSSKRVALK